MRNMYNLINCPELNIVDGGQEIQVLDLYKKVLPDLLSKYGQYCTIVFDAGFNNIGVEVRPSKKIKDKSKKVKVVKATKKKVKIVKGKPKRGMSLVQLKYNAPHVGRYT